MTKNASGRRYPVSAGMTLWFCFLSVGCAARCANGAKSGFGCQVSVPKPPVTDCSGPQCPNQSIVINCSAVQCAPAAPAAEHSWPWSTIWAAVSALGTVFIGMFAARISARSDRAQRVHNQIRMVLDVDRELINCPQLFEEIYKKNDTNNQKDKVPTSGASSQEQGVRKETAQRAVPASPALDLPVAIGSLTTSVQELAISVHKLTSAINESKTLSPSELESKTDALRFSYFNMFDFVHGFYDRESWFSKLERRLWFSRQEKEDWEAWKNYMAVFFGIKRNSDFWEKENQAMYPKSFTEFINNQKYKSQNQESPYRTQKPTKR